MTRSPIALDPARPLVTGSFGNAASLHAATPEAVAKACDIVEIRLDLLEAEGALDGRKFSTWTGSSPLLFTARRASEGGAGDLSAARRVDLVKMTLDEAAAVDVELSSAAEMSELLDELKRRALPWVASWHDFEGRPDSFDRIPALAGEAARAGAACFKAAVRLHSPADLEKLAACLKAESPLPLSLMGMGPLAPVSRLLAAQCGSVLNYGYIGDAPTAPGQWSAELLKTAVSALERV